MRVDQVLSYSSRSFDYGVIQLTVFDLFEGVNKRRKTPIEDVRCRANSVLARRRDQAEGFAYSVEHRIEVVNLSQITHLTF